MRKLKVSLICVFAAVLCCALFAFIGINAYENNKLSTGATEQTEISAPEKDTTPTLDIIQPTSSTITDGFAKIGQPTGAEFSGVYTYNSNLYYTTITVPYTGSAVTLPLEDAMASSAVSFLSATPTGVTATTSSIKITSGAVGTYQVAYKTSNHDGRLPWSINPPVESMSLSLNDGLSTGAVTDEVVNPQALSNYSFASNSDTLTILKVIIVDTSVKDISTCTITAPSAQTYTGSALTPAPTVKDGTKTLVKGTDYTLTYSNNTNAGTATVKITGIGNYTGSVSKTFTINKASLSLTLTYGTVTYGGSAVTPTLSGNSGSGTTTYSVTAGTGKATINSSTGALTPSQAGTVTVTVSVAATTNYNSGSKSVTVTINKASLSLGLTYSTVTYGSTSAAPSLTGNSGSGTATYSVAAGTGKATINSSTGALTPTQAGTVTVTVSVAATTNYNSGTKSVTVTINKASLSLGLTYSTVTYGSTSAAPSLTGNSGSGTATYSVAAGTGKATINSSTGALTPSQAGTVTVTVSVAATTNYNSGSKSVTVTINKASLSLNLTYGTVTYGSTSAAPSLTGNSGSGTATYSVAAGTGTATINSSTGALTPTQAGTVTVTVSVAATTNYNSGTKSVTVTINKASQTPSITSTATTVVYGSTITMTGSGQGTLSWSSSDTTVATVNSSTGVVTPVKAGSVTITLTAAGNTNYNSGTATKTITVQRKAIAIPTLAKGTGAATSATVSAQTATTTYNAAAQHFTISSTTNITFGTPTSGATRSGTDFYATNAGTYTVSMSIDSNKYCWGSTNGGTDTANKTLTLTINKASISLGLTYSTVTYGGGAVTPTLTGNSGSGTATYSVAAGTGKATINSSTGALTPTQAGTVTVTVSVAATTNYAAGSKSVTVTINKASISPNLTYSTVTYGSTSAAPTLTGNSGNGTPSYTVAAGTGSATINASTGALTPTQAGTVSVTVSIPATTNYLAGSKTVTVTINKASISPNLTYGTLTYGGSAVTPTLTGNSGNGTPTYTVEAGTGSATINASTGALTPTQAGTVSVTVSIPATTNYLAGSKTVTVTINKASISPNLTYGTITYGGSAVTPTLTGNSGNGTPTYTVAAGTGSATINASTGALTPTKAGTVSVTVSIPATTNYAAGSKTVTVTINAKAITDSTVTVAAPANQTFTGSALTPVPTVKDGTATLVKDTDYTVSYTPNVNVGTVTVTVTGKGNYSGSRTTSFEILAKDISTLTLTAPANQTYYANSELTPLPTLKYGTITLVAEQDFTVEYSSNVNAGTARVVIKGKGNYTGTANTSFEIARASLADVEISPISAQGYTGSAIKPKLNITQGSYTLVEGVDYNLTYKDNINAGTATVTVTGCGNFTDVEERNFEISKAIPTATVSIMEGYYYVGDTIENIIISVNESSVPGTVKWSNPDTVISGVAGSYEWTFVPDNAEDYNPITGYINIPAYYKLMGITVTGARTDYKAYEAFDKEGATVTATYQAGKADTKVTDFIVTYPTAGLSYFIASDDGKSVTITYTESGITKTETVQIAIIKADYDMSGVSMEDLTVTYDGNIHSLTYSGVLPTGVYVDGYKYNGVKAAYAMDAGTYTVEAIIRIADEANYNMPALSATLTIEKATPTATASVMDGYYYVGDKLEGVVISVSDSSVPGTIKWTNANSIITSANGSYGWTFTPDDTDNYKSITGTAQVAAYYKLTGITVTGAKSLYKAHESFDTTGMTVTASYAAGKVNTAVTGYTIIYPTAGLDHFLITDDYKDLTISYTENGITVTASVTIVIDANEYDMSGVDMEDLNVSYDGTYHKLTYTGTLPEGVKVVGYKYDGELNSIGAKNAGTYLVEAVFEIADTENYKYPRLSATLTIEKATPTATASVAEGYYYVGDRLGDIEISLGDSNVAGSIAWTNGNALLTGANGVYSWTFTPEDTENYKQITGTAQVAANYKLARITVTGAKTVYKAHETFDTTGMTVTASYEAGKANTVVTDYVITYPTAGLNEFITYDDGKNVIISYTEGGITKTATVTITIDANEYDISGVEMEDLTVSYDGENHTITYTGTLPEGVRVVGYTYNGEESATGVSTAGTYLVEAVFEIADPENYKPPRLSATLTIEKATPTATASVAGGYHYVGDELNTVVITVGTSSVKGSIEWTNGGAAITGTANSYGWTFTPDDTENYNTVTGTAKVTAYYKLMGITVTGAKNFYKPHESFDPTGMTVIASYAAGKADTAVTNYFVSYPTEGMTEFVITDDGKELTVTYIENGITVKAGVTILIDALEYDMTGVSLDNVTVTYDGDYHSLSVTGNLPDGVVLTGFNYNGEYSAQGVKNVGIYEVEAVFEIADPDNYKMPKLSGVLVINKATPTATASVEEGYYYVGDELGEVVINVGESSVPGTITWTNADAVITGTANSYGWTFTPDDTENYKQITGTVQVKAYYKLAGLTVINAKSTYKAYESFDRTGMIVVAHYETGKPDTAVTGYSVTYPTAGATRFVVSDDGKSLIISYTENGITVTAEVVISIEANEYDMSGVSLDDLTITYDGELHMLEMTGKLPDGVALKGFTYNDEENTEGVKNAGTYVVKAIFVIADPDNYKMPELSATLVINMATPEVTAEIISEYVYVGDTLGDVTIAIADSSVTGTIKWTNASAIITGTAGSYGWTFIPDDTDNYKQVTGSLQVAACYKLTGITVNNPKTSYKTYESFDTTGMTVVASYAAGKANTVVTGYDLIYPTEGLTHFVIYDDGKSLTVSYTENGITVTEQIVITIDANEYDMTGVSLSELTLDYDGELHTLTLTGELPDGVRIVGYNYNGEYSVQGVKDAGTYTVEAVFEIDDPDNYKVPKLSSTLVINKGTPTAEAKVLSVYYYVGDALNSVNISVGTSSVPGTIKWTNESAVITGTTGSYGWTFTPDDATNYNEITGTAQVTAYYKLTNITVTNAKTTYMTYDSFDTTGMVVTARYAAGKADTAVEDYFITYPTVGLDHFIISDDGKAITVTYLENGMIATATVTITIDANEYDMSGVNMEDLTVSYDGDLHSIAMTGTLPEGVTLIGYTYNGEDAAGVKNAGTYIVEAVFEIADPDNYKVPKLSATLEIEKATPTATAKVISEYVYVGDELGAVNIDVATSNVPGTVKWTDESSLIMGVMGVYSWTFTPEDSENYKEITGNLQLRAYYKLVGLTVFGGNNFYKPYESFDTTGLTVIASYEAGKVNTVVTNYTITYPTPGLDHFLITDDGKSLVISYTENGLTATAEIIIEIDALQYDMTGVDMEDLTVTYDGDYHSIAMTGTLPEGVTLIGYKYNGVESSIGVTTAGTYLVEAIFEVADPENYKVPRLSATLKINKATPSATANILSGNYYVGDKLETVIISVAGSSVPGTIKWTDGNTPITGTTGRYGWTFIPDDTANYNEINGTSQVTAYYKLSGITVTGAKGTYKTFESFDTTGMTVIASYVTGKTDTVVTGYSVIYPTEGLNYFVITDDGKELTISYTENGITVTAPVTITIDANEYDMSGVSMEDATVSYDGGLHSITLTGTLPEGVALKGYTYNGEANDDGVLNVGTYLVEAVFVIANPESYKMPRLSATLTVTKGTPEVEAEVEEGYYYVGDSLSGINISVGSGNVEGTIKWTDESAVINGTDGSYGWTFIPDDTDNYDQVTGTVAVKAYHKLTGITVTGAKTNYKTYDTFDKTGMTVVASYETGKADTIVTDYTVTYPTEGATYFLISDDGKNVTITYTEGGISATATVTISIDANEYDMSGVKMEDLTVTYDGENHTITLTGDLPEGVTLIGYTYNGEENEGGVKNAGTYLVEAIFEIADTENYKAPKLSATLYINKAKPTATVEILSEYNYVGDGLGSVNISVNESSVPGTIGWTNANAIITSVADSYGWTFIPEDTENYLQITGTIQVNACYKLTGITVTGAKDTYKAYESFDKTGMTVVASYAVGKVNTKVENYTLTYPTEGLEYFVITDDGKSLIISYTENGITVTAPVVITIDANEYDMTGVSMEDLTVTYDGATHSVTLTGTLPAGVTLVGYTYNGEFASGVKNAGEYEVSAVFEVADPENYKVPRLSAKLVINKATPEATAKVTNVYYYVGDALGTVKISVGSSSVAGTVKWTDATATIAGTSGSYGWTFIPNDAVNYNEITGTAQVTAYYKLSGLTVTGAKDTYRPYESFDPTGMVVTASYESGKAEARIDADYCYITYPTDGLTYFVITDDGKNLVITYIENGVTASATVTISIEANEYDMSGVTMTDVTLTYDGEFHSIALQGTLPEGVTLTGYTYNGIAYSQGVKTAGTYTVEAVFEVDDPDNYKVPKLSATLEIKKAKPTATVKVVDGTYYVGDDLSTVELTLSASSVPGTVKWTDDEALIMGVTGSYGWTFVPDDADNYDTYKGIIGVSAYYKLSGLTVTGANDFYKPYESFDTTGMVVTASYEVGKPDVVVTDYEITYPTKGLTYFLISDDGNDLVISYTENGITVTAGITITIDAYEYDMTGVSMEDKTVTYDGGYHTLTLTGELPEGVTLKGYRYNGLLSVQGVRTAGTYTVEAVFEIANPDSYKVPKVSATLTIEKAATTATANVTEGVYYVGDALGTVEINVGESSVSGTVKWTDETALIAGVDGSYSWTFVPDDSENYATYTGTAFVSAYYKLAGLTISGGNNVYKPNESFDRTGMTVVASYVMGKNPIVVTNYEIIYPTSGLDYFVISDDGKELTVSYTENGITVTAGITIEIDAYEYDMSGVSMEDVTVTYDRGSHSITLTGTLPEGVTLVGYTYNGEENEGGVTEAGAYLVEAVFEVADPESYKMPKLSATLEIEAAQLSSAKVALEETVFTYDGSAKTPEVTSVKIGNLTLLEGEYTVDYSDNINAGTATVTVTANKNFSGEKTVEFTINKATPTIDVSEVITEYVYTGELQIIDSGATVDNDEQTVEYDETTNRFVNVADGDGLHVIIFVAETANYQYADAEVIISVDRARVENSVTFTDVTDAVYDGSVHYLTVEGSLADDMQVTYVYAGADTPFEGVTDVKYDGNGNVTAYEVTAKFTSISGNYYPAEDMTATLTINPYVIAESEVGGVDSEYGYTGEPMKLDPVITVALADGEFTLDDGYTVDYSTTDYTLYTQVTVTVTVNYNGNIVGTVIKEVTITKGTIEVVWNESENGYIYNGNAQGVTVNGISGLAASDEGRFTYTVIYAGVGDNYYYDTEMPTNAGVYTVTVTFDGNGIFENYKLSSANALYKQFEIAKATVKVEVIPAAHGTLYEGGSLPELRINGEATSGSLTVAGTVVWDKSGDEPLALKLGNNSYVWVFVPEDTANFNPATGIVPLTAVRAEVRENSLTASWKGGVQPDVIYTSTTLTEVRDYLTVKVLHAVTGEEIEISAYDIKGSWGNTPSPDTDKAGTYYYIISYDGQSQTLDVVYKSISVVGIKVAPATTDGIKTDYLGLDVFDTDSIIVTIVYTDGTEKAVTDYSVIYEDGRGELWVGDAYVTIVYANGNSSFEERIEVNVEKRHYDLSGLVFDDMTVDYDGAEKAYAIKGDFEIGSVEYVYEQEVNGEWVEVTEVKNAGTYRVSARFILDEGRSETNYLDDFDAPYAYLTINRIAPKVNPTVIGNLAAGTQLYQLTLVGDDGEIAGTYTWLNDESELMAGLSRYQYVFTPEDTVNYDSYKGYIEIRVDSASGTGTGTGAATGGGILSGKSDWLLIALVAIAGLSCLLTLIALIAIAKKRQPASGDEDGFYDDVTDADLQ